MTKLKEYSKEICQLQRPSYFPPRLLSPRAQMPPNNVFYYHQAGQTTCPAPVNIFIMGIIYLKIMRPNCVHTKLSCSALYSEIFLYFIYQYVKYHISTIHILNKCVHKLVSIYLDQSLYQTFVGIWHERLLSIYLFSIPGLSLTVWKILLAWRNWMFIKSQQAIFYR